jgi:antitoxin component YwqK of YwqJK toxin-antitoxin module
MEWFVSSLFFFLPAMVFSQKINKFYDYQWKETTSATASYFATIEKTDSGWHRSDFYIDGGTKQMDGYYTDSACKIPQGRFVFYHPNRMLSSQGIYVNGKKQGLWLSYYSNGLMSDSITYQDGQMIGTNLQWHRTGYASDSTNLNEDGSGVKVSWFDNGNVSFAGIFSKSHMPYGKWKYYHKNGKLSDVEIYNHGQLVEKKYYDEQEKLLRDTVNHDRPAEFPGGLLAWQKYLEKKLTFPKKYRIINSDMVVIVIDATIDENGKLTDIETRVPFHPVFNKIALEVMTKSPAWLPAVDHNRRVKCHISQPIEFSQ